MYHPGVAVPWKCTLVGVAVPRRVQLYLVLYVYIIDGFLPFLIIHDKRDDKHKIK
jgi:hypothetical protein